MNGNGNNVWKFIAVGALSALGGLLTGQFLPNRSIVTADQLAATLSPIHTQLATQSAQITDLSSKVSELTGEIHAQQEFERKATLQRK